MTATAYRVAADLTLYLHVAFVAFVVFGLVAILLGGFLGWRYVRNPWFRWAHLMAIGVVVVQAWLGIICPLTTFEMYLRRRGGDAAYTGSFVAHWMDRLLFYDAPAWVFTVAYSLFAALVVGSWFGVRPRRFSAETPAGGSP